MLGSLNSNIVVIWPVLAVYAFASKFLPFQHDVEIYFPARVRNLFNCSANL